MTSRNEFMKKRENDKIIEWKNKIKLNDKWKLELELKQDPQAAQLN